MSRPFRHAAESPLRGEKDTLFLFFLARSADFSRMSDGWPSWHGGFSRKNSTQASKPDSLLGERFPIRILIALKCGAVSFAGILIYEIYAW